MSQEMNNISNNLTLVIGCHEYTGSWKLEGEVLKWEIRDKKFSINGENLEESVRKFLRVLEKRVFKDKCKIKACMTCENFFMSGMGRDMSRGQRGVCKLLNIRAEICYLCKNYVERPERS